MTIQPSRRSFLAGAIGLPALALLNGMAEAGEDSAAPVRLRFVVADGGFGFDTGFLRGRLCGDGRALGLAPLAVSASGIELARPPGLLSIYRLLDRSHRYLPDGRDWACRTRLSDDGAAEVAWAADEAHPFDMTATYRWSGPGTLDLTLGVSAKGVLRGFEVFLASYFHGFPRCSVRARREGGEAAAWLATDPAAGTWQMFPRDERAAGLIADGRWKHPPISVEWAIRSPYAEPVGLRRDPGAGLTALVLTPQGRGQHSRSVRAGSPGGRIRDRPRASGDRSRSRRRAGGRRLQGLPRRFMIALLGRRTGIEFTIPMIRSYHQNGTKRPACRIGLERSSR